MPNIINVIFGEKVIQDLTTKHLTIVNMIDSIQSEQFPIFIPTFHVIIVSQRNKNEKSKYECIINIKNNKNVLFDSRVTIDYGDWNTNKIISKVYGFVIPEPGYLIAEVIIGRQKPIIYKISAIKIGNPRVELSNPSS